MKKIALFIIALSVSALTHADIRLPKILADNMVLQRNKSLIFWGWADPNEKVTVQFNKQSKAGKADKTGKWKIALAAESAGGPYQLIIKGKNTITLSNILVGEVWVCSGQSNMEWPLRASNNADLEIQQANYPEIRHLTVQKHVSSKPEEDVRGGDWKICSPETAGDFTAVGYFFAREIYNRLKIPVGLIHTSWGGTHSETWTSREAFENSVEFKDMIASMPAVDLDALAKQKNEALVKHLKELNITLPLEAVTEKWKDFTLDDSQWPTMKLPGLWEYNGLGELDGLVWFRKAVTLSASDAVKEATIDLSMIDDSDETFVNGTKIGATKKYNEMRKYKIPAGILKEGKNTIAVRVDDTGGGGGIYGEAKDLKLTIDKNVISLAGDWSYNIEKLISGGSSVGPNSYPTLLFNAMLNPLFNYSIEGALWYQGESNAGRAYQYRTAFPLMIQDWRNHWKQGDFPFYFVQLSSFNYDNGNSQKGSAWAELREAQTMTLSLPNTGMAVTTDIGNAKDIHPRNKQDVGKRLALVALHHTYRKKVEYSGPVYQSMCVNSKEVILSFLHNDGLRTQGQDGMLIGFEIAGEDQHFYKATARISGKHVIITAPEILIPVAVRYAWADDAGSANLINQSGLPAVPFRTDNWPGITINGKYQITGK